jgi:hypothetical protein
MTDIERAARACCQTTCVREVCEAENRCMAVDSHALASEMDRARAVISAALSDPSEAMVKAALSALADWHIAPPRAAVRAALIAAGQQITGDIND